MSDPFPTDPVDGQAPDVSLRTPLLPAWLARRLLQADETVTWVRGPRLNPWWERYATHPGLFLLALALGAACLGVGWLIAGSWSGLPLPAGLAAGGIVLGAIYALAIANAYFTRLVVTDRRLVVVQGYEVCRSWGLDQLPRSLVRFRVRDDGRASRTIDLTALQTMLGGPSDQFADAKTIRSVGRQIDQIKARENDRR
jgi:hypothetical protein